MEAGDPRAAGPTPGTGEGPAGGQGQPSQEELRAQLEEQLRQVRVQDLVAESLASIVNLTARRIAKEDERDLEQARVGIEAARMLVDLVDEQVRPQFRDALSQVQMLFARHAGGGEGGEGGSAGPAGGGDPSGPGPGGEQPPPGGRPGGGSGLWTPHER